MKIFQILATKLLSAVALVAGVMLIAAMFTPNVADFVNRYREAFLAWPGFVREGAQVVCGVLLVVIGLLGLLPMMRLGRRRQIAFTGPHGDVAFDLDSVATTIGRVVGKMEEVNKIHVTVVPVENNQKADITAEVVLNPPNAGARQAANRVHTQVERAAVQILGRDQVSRVALRVKRILVNVKKLTELPAEEEEAPLAAPVAGGAAVATAGGLVRELEGLEEAEAEAREEAEEALERERKRHEREEEREAEVVEPVAPVTAPVVVERDVFQPETPEPDMEPEPEVEPEREEARPYGIDLGDEDAAAPSVAGTSPWDAEVQPGSPFEYERPPADVSDNLPSLDALPAEEESPEVVPEDVEEPRMPLIDEDDEKRDQWRAP